MTYTGEVAVGGPPDLLELDTTVVSKVAVGPMNNNAYLLRCKVTGATCLVDAAAEEDTLLRLIREQADARLDSIVTTHRHPDHWGALAAVAAATNAPTHAGRADVAGIPVPTQEPVDHGQLLRLGDAVIEVVGLPGHTPGSIALLLEAGSDAPVVVTGDALFPGGVGRTRSPEDFTSAFDAVRRELFDRLPDRARVLPGHGWDTTLGAERGSLPGWRARGW